MLPCTALPSSTALLVSISTAVLEFIILSELRFRVGATVSCNDSTLTQNGFQCSRYPIALRYDAVAAAPALQFHYQLYKLTIIYCHPPDPLDSRPATALIVAAFLIA